MRPDTWLDELAHELAVRGVGQVDVASIVVELQGHLVEAGVAPLSAFGAPARYAEVVVASLAPQPQPQPHAPARRGPRRVRGAGVTLSYRRRPVLAGVDLEVRAGEVVLVIGPNGCGKSSLLRVVAGLVEPDAGRVRVDGTVGYAPQTHDLVEHLRPREHFILFGRRRGLDRDDAVRAGRIVADQLGWDALAAPVVAHLSGGTRQKLNVALAALGEPDVLLLDEPYQGLDLDSTQRFWDLLASWRSAGAAALVVSHAHDAIERADAVLELPATAGRAATTPAARAVRS